jgi:subtilisin family serine protease
MKRIMYRLLLTCALLLHLGGFRVVAQDYFEDRLYIQLNDLQLKPSSGGTIQDSVFAKTLNDHNAEIEIGFPYALTDALKNVYHLQTPDAASLFNSIVQLNDPNIGYVERIPIPQTLYDPEDWFWQGHISGAFENAAWWLDIVDAELAWDITRGNPDLKICVSDGGFDINHPELASKIDPPYDVATGGSLLGTEVPHGSSVASILAGETAEIGTIPEGQMASIGFNLKVMCTLWSLSSIHTASIVHDARIISISWYNSCSATSTGQLVEQEVLDNGTIVVKAAGNGPTMCNGGPLYPFSGVTDDRVIVVTGTDINDSHENTMNTVTTVSSYPEVDIAAPAYSILSAVESDPTNPNDWPYAGWWGGTSQSTPIVSGTIGLMLSVNPCLNMDDVDFIIKECDSPFDYQ